MIAIGVAGASLGGLIVWAWLSPRESTPSLPARWSISPRPVFNASERRLYRQLRDAFPQHVVMPKLPLVRLCQPDDRAKVEYWYSLLGSTHATFTICSASGKALLAIDLESRRARSKRNLEIKEAVLNACQIGYFSIAADGMPTIAALRLLLPQQAADASPMTAQGDSAPAPASAQGRELPAVPAAPRPADAGSGRWKDSSVFLDSFFTPDSRLDVPGNAGARHGLPDSLTDNDRSSDIGGVVIEGGAETVKESSERRAAGR